jgi:hypothetical protein
MDKSSLSDHFAEQPEADMDLQVYDPDGILRYELEEGDIFPDSLPIEQENPLEEAFLGFSRSTAEQLKPVLGKKIVGVEVRGGETELQTPEYVFHLESESGDWIEFSISYLLKPGETGTDFFLKLGVQTIWGHPPPKGVFNKVNKEVEERYVFGYWGEEPLILGDRFWQMQFYEAGNYPQGISLYSEEEVGCLSIRIYPFRNQKFVFDRTFNG